MAATVSPEERPVTALLDTAREVIRRDALAVAGLVDQLGAEFTAVVQVLEQCTGKVLVTGMGTSGATARRLAHLLSVGGTPATFAHAADGLHGSLGLVAPGDVVIAISKGGESDELNEYVRRAGERGAYTVAITSARDSGLAKASRQLLVTTTPDDVDPGGMIAMGSALASCALGDALVVCVMHSREGAWERFEHSHPGGAVGKRISDRAGGTNEAAGP